MKILNFIKKEAVFFISALVALISAFFVPPSKEYINYINFSVLGILFSLMCVVEGLSRQNVLDIAAERLISRTKGLRSLVAALFSLCFFTAMFITNDVALITFVPLSITLLQAVNKGKYIIPTVAMQTCAANMGSMLTPMGNPQNLFIYEHYNMSMSEFLLTTLPYVAFSYILLIILLFVFIKNDALNVSLDKPALKSKKLLALYCILGILSILSVLKILDHRITAAFTFISLLISDRKTLCTIDWFLLLTFVMFFIFVGNISGIAAVREHISKTVNGREYAAAAIISQFISNVPCAAMLSGFTDNYKALLVGCDIGGSGTLVASLANLIAFRLYMQHCKSPSAKKFILGFSILSIVFLTMLTLLYIII